MLSVTLLNELKSSKNIKLKGIESLVLDSFLVVRRIGMTKPPVKLGVGKKFLEKRKEPPSDRMKLVWQPQHFNIGGSMSMNDVKSLSHSKWRCKYILFLLQSIEDK